MTRVPRPIQSLIAFWAVAGFAALFVGDALVRGAWVVFAESVAPAGLVVWTMWLVLYRPLISFDPDHIVTVNPLRIIDVPWQHVTGLTQRLQVELELDDGGRVTCWASPFPDKPGRQRPERGVSTSIRDNVVGPLEAARVAAHRRSSDAPISKRWDVVALGIGLVLVVVCLLQIAIVH